MITVGLDFGTHQTKVCIEDQEGVELHYSFLKFHDEYGNSHYTLPSIINIDSKGLLSYGFIPSKEKGEIIRYFKQGTFTNVNTGMSQIDAMYYSIWYIAYILFGLEETYGQNFTIQMGVPTDSSRLERQKQMASVVLASAYHLVEDVFDNDENAFIDCSLILLKEKTEIISYSKEVKEEYRFLIFPEAYACLMPLTSSSKIDTGMSLMVDIGGGTTDISFFTIKEDHPQLYDFKSVNKGLNYLTEYDLANDERLDSNVTDISDIKQGKEIIYINEINNLCAELINSLYSVFSKKSNLAIEKLKDTLKHRPIVYSGGGSLFDSLRRRYCCFEDIIEISDKAWKSNAIIELEKIKKLGLCPILSTAYGLAIHVVNDEIPCTSLNEVFDGANWDDDEKQDTSYNGRSSYRNPSYYFERDDYYTLNYSRGNSKKHGKRHR